MSIRTLLAVVFAVAAVLVAVLALQAYFSDLSHSVSPADELQPDI